MTWQELKDKYPDINDSDLGLALYADPTSNKDDINGWTTGDFCEWLVNLIKNNSLTYENYKAVKTGLQMYLKNKRGFRSIESYRSAEDFLSDIQEIKSSRVLEECDLVYENEESLLLRPKSLEAYKMLEEEARWDLADEDYQKCVADGAVVLIDRTSPEYRFLIDFKRNYCVDNRGYTVDWWAIRRDFPDVFEYLVEHENILDLLDASDLAGMINSENELRDNPKLKEKLLNEIDKILGDNDHIQVEVTAHDLADKSSTDLSESFIEDAIVGDLWTYFDGYDADDLSQMQYHVKDEMVEKLGISAEDFCNILTDKEGYEGRIEDDIKDELISVYTEAYRRGVESGSCNQAEDDFQQAFRDALPRGVELTNGFDGGRKLLVSVKREYLTDDTNLFNFLEQFGYYSNDLLANIETQVIDDICNEFDFREPYYGWNEFDEEWFEESFYELLDELIDRVGPIDVAEYVEFDLDDGTDDVGESLTPEKLNDYITKLKESKVPFKRIVVEAAKKIKACQDHRLLNEDWYTDYDYNDIENMWSILAKDSLDYYFDKANYSEEEWSNPFADGDTALECTFIYYNLSDDEKKNLAQQIGSDLYENDWINEKINDIVWELATDELKSMKDDVIGSSAELELDDGTDEGDGTNESKITRRLGGPITEDYDPEFVKEVVNRYGDTYPSSVCYIDSFEDVQIAIPQWKAAIEEQVYDGDIEPGVALVISDMQTGHQLYFAVFENNEWQEDINAFEGFGSIKLDDGEEETEDSFGTDERVSLEDDDGTIGEGFEEENNLDDIEFREGGDSYEDIINKYIVHEDRRGILDKKDLLAENDWFISLETSDGDWIDGNVDPADFAGFFTFEQALEIFLDYELDSGETLIIMFAPSEEDTEKYGYYDFIPVLHKKA